MAKIIGEVARLNNLDTIYNASNAAVTVQQHGKTIASATTDADERFEIELPDGIEGEIEVHLGLPHAAPVAAMADGNDIAVTVLYNNQQHFG